MAISSAVKVNRLLRPTTVGLAMTFGVRLLRHPPTGGFLAMTGEVHSTDYFDAPPSAPLIATIEKTLPNG